jgi:hypothetical protein
MHGAEISNGETERLLGHLRAAEIVTRRREGSKANQR